MGNFDFLKEEAQFASFAPTALTAQWLYSVNPAVCVATCRQTMEFAIKWMYDNDAGLEMPGTDRLATLMSAEDFVRAIGPQLHTRLDFVRRLGNDATHLPRVYTQAQAALALENLYYFLRFLQHCYGAHAPQEPIPFDKEKLMQSAPCEMPVQPGERVQDELRAKQQELRLVRARSFVSPDLDLGEFETRKIYIEALLQEAGWVLGQNLMADVPLEVKAGEDAPQTADYVLLDEKGKPLAIVEAVGARVQAESELLRAQAVSMLIARQNSGTAPFIFLSNGLETIFCPGGGHAPRNVSGLYAQEDLLFERQKMSRRVDPGMELKTKIADRYYQKEAVYAVMDAYFVRRQRTALLSMASGSGKTRTALMLCEALLRAGVVGNILFLAQETVLVTQIRREAARFLPDISSAQPKRDRRALKSGILCAAYDELGDYIDGALDTGGGRIFTAGHFDLVICDEADHRIYRRHRALIEHFDAWVLGLTDCGAADIDPRTYEAFRMGENRPTYAYELSRAIADRYLVDYTCVRIKTRLLQSGLDYDALDAQEKERFEAAFGGKKLLRRVDAQAFAGAVFNEDTARQMFAALMRHGIHTENGAQLGKTIVFASCKAHAQELCRVFASAYPDLPADYCRVVDAQEAYAQDLLDDFRSRSRLPRIAVSVGVLGAGVDVPACVNLVFFKPVESREVFMRMIGRGTRICRGLLGGKDKEKFCVLDFFGNFEAFSDRFGAGAGLLLPGRIFALRARLVHALGGEEAHASLRRALAEQLRDTLLGLNRAHFAVRAQLKLVEHFSHMDAYDSLSVEDIKCLVEKLAPLSDIGKQTQDDRVLALDHDFCALMLSRFMPEMAASAQRGFARQMRRLTDALHVPEVLQHAQLIRSLDTPLAASLLSLEQIESARMTLRTAAGAAGSIDGTHVVDFSDEVLEVSFFSGTQSAQAYLHKAEAYVAAHPNDPVLVRLRHNEPLRSQDLAQLEKLAFEQLGTREAFDAAAGGEGVGMFFRRCTGLDAQAVRSAFDSALAGEKLTPQANGFIRQAQEYLCKNGVLRDKTILALPPFDQKGSCLVLFTPQQLAKVLETVDSFCDTACVVGESQNQSKKKRK